MILGFDPGRDKCGIAVMAGGRIHYHRVVSATEAIATIEQLVGQFPIQLVIMGNLTTSKSWQQKLQAKLGSLTIVMVDEHNSSLEARDRYWQMYPPQGLKRLIPQGLRLPPRPIDDLVAVILIERYLNNNKICRDV